MTLDAHQTLLHVLQFLRMLFRAVEEDPRKVMQEFLRRDVKMPNELHMLLINVGDHLVAKPAELFRVQAHGVGMPKEMPESKESA